MAKKIIVTLDSKSIDDAIKQIKEYKNELHTKAMEFTKRLAEVGYHEANIIVNSIPSDFTDEGITVDFTVGESTTATIFIEGTQVAFIEFGAGTYYNTGIGDTLHPDGRNFGFTIGSYNPGSGNVERGWWWYNGKVVLGTPTYMPMYKAYEKMAADIIHVAKQVFA